MSAWEAAFNFDSLVWDWIIAIYLFLAGVSAGAVMLTIYLKKNVIKGDASESGIIKAMALLAPLGIIIGLTILIFHLHRPLTFWHLMFNFNPSSIMSMGVVLFQVYMVVLFAWLAIIFHKQLRAVLPEKLDFVNVIIEKIQPLTKTIEFVLAILAILLAAYTGFLLSALKTYPLLNNPVLPVLFLFSSLSSGAAACLLFGIIGFKESSHSDAVAWLHRVEKPVVLFELFLLVTFFVGLILGGGQSEVAAWNAIGHGFWATWFWVGVIAVGMIIPLAMNYFAPTKVQKTNGFVLVVTSLSLIGVLMLRIFILYAGQMTLV
ncbi:cytochrome c nitrite reductase subunit NrfD [Vibrio sp. SS-MA-C1-2]|uniref:cytochrome c nitrite reductase subunit NrfD n=1 Tax=Vibrio sp. SS-MA-C1-2 TaxID=2908646 RepID=UPI001F3A0A0F|nr:cytochrome c nitrite reductase subunit NrfD [Vibrio sp. SS-MA-C1-2]UJF18197.1 cytochrome c nitrite reductase subunit NrfD [Vibrio sp. SS-MA-C1-2]